MQHIWYKSESRMDIIRFAGGLGNQMFQYALAEALRYRGREVRGSLGFYKKHPEASPYLLDNVFTNIEMEYISECEFEIIDNKWKEIKKKGKEEFCANYAERFFWVEDILEEPCTYQPNVFLTKNCTFVGYWQTEKYFKDIRDILDFRFKFNRVSSELKKFEETISKGTYTGVHIRRGDYLLNPEIYMGICTEDYYKKAIDFVRMKESDSKFVFFSDDMSWVKEKFNIPNAVYCNKGMFDYYEDWYDMYLMSKCQHNIIANSSFSWWGAWLNRNKGKIVITPKKWNGVSDTPDIWCEGWVRL